MLSNNVQSATQSFISNLGLVCEPVRRFPCVAIHNSIEAIRSNNTIAPFICTVVMSTTIGGAIAAVVADELSLSVAMPVGILSGIGAGFLSCCVASCIVGYCAKKVDAHEKSPDPSSDDEIMLPEIVERNAAYDVIDV